MCGIFGQITPGRPVDPSACLAALNSIRHRGPDGLGIAAGRLARQTAEFGREPAGQALGRSSRPRPSRFSSSASPVGRRRSGRGRHTSRWPTRTARSGSSSTAKSTTTRASARRSPPVATGSNRPQRTRRRSSTDTSSGASSSRSAPRNVRPGGARPQAALPAAGPRPLAKSRSTIAATPAGLPSLPKSALSAVSAINGEVDPAALVDYVVPRVHPRPADDPRRVSKPACGRGDHAGSTIPNKPSPAATGACVTYLAESDRGESRWQEEFEEELGRAVRMRLMSDARGSSSPEDWIPPPLRRRRPGRRPSRSAASRSGLPIPATTNRRGPTRRPRLPTEHHRRIVSPSDLLDGAEAVAGIFDEPFADLPRCRPTCSPSWARSTSRSPFPATEATSCSPATPATHSSSGSAAGSIGCPTDRAGGRPSVASLARTGQGARTRQLIRPGLEARYRRVFSDDVLRGQMRREAVAAGRTRFHKPKAL